ncbi:MAG: hypothetical protein ACRC1K_07030 [Planctomycetia bacterium]
MNLRRFVIVGFLAAVALSTQADSIGRADDFYMVVFSAQSPGLIPKHAHNLAAFVRVATPATADDAAECEIKTMSWVPCTGTVRYLCRPEKGCNWSLEKSFDWSLGQGARLRQWGPYRVDERLFRKACEQIDTLESGSCRWVMVDWKYRQRKGAFNCVHALCDVDVGKGCLRTGVARGDMGARTIVRHMGPYIFDGGREHPEIDALLSLDRFTIERQPFPGFKD